MKTARRRSTQEGNALIEFVLIATTLFLFSAGIADFSRLITLISVADGGASAGTQYAALSPAHYNDFTGIQNAAVAGTGNYSGATASATQFCSCSVGGTQVSCPATCATGTAETYV